MDEVRENALVPELSVRDLEASLRFYCDLLGFAVVYARLEEGFAFLERDGCQLMLDQIGLGRTWQTGPLEPPLGRGINLQLRISGLAGPLARIEAAGVPLFLPLETREYRVGEQIARQRQFCVQDADGYLLRFCEDADLLSRP
jgi:catechol 2,3-dioxygenase-like lactoylglutathione lyase family enzyme